VAELPGGDIIAAGLDDLAHGRETLPALLVSIGAPRLTRLGFAIPHPVPDPERRRYELLARENAAAARGRYNALVRRLVSFERAAECALADRERIRRLMEALGRAAASSVRIYLVGSQPERVLDDRGAAPRLRAAEEEDRAETSEGM
jgi:hypothetical protein